jgi:hypothetical protein
MSACVVSLIGLRKLIARGGNAADAPPVGVDDLEYLVEQPASPSR